MTTFDKIKDMIVDQLDVEADEVTMDANIQEDLGADSLDVFQIVMGIEDEFDIKIPAEKTEKIATVGEAVELIKEAVNGK